MDRRREGRVCLACDTLLNPQPSALGGGGTLLFDVVLDAILIAKRA